METLVLDCTKGARKDSLVDGLLGMLGEDALTSFLALFNSSGPQGVSAAICDDGDAAHLVVRSNGLTEHESRVQNAHGEAADVEDGSHAHSHLHRSLGEVESIVNSLSISDSSKKDALGVYGILAEAEAKSHGAPVEDVHFHEVGNDFAIAYIVAFAMLVEMLGPKDVVSTPITTGFGFVDCAHGRLPIPAPATANILDGMEALAGDVEGELTTPTGAAMVRYYAGLGQR